MLLRFVKIFCTGFHNLKKLHHLALASNLITSIADCGLNSMPHLQFLDVSDNLISSLDGLRHCNSLQLLYASNNKICDCRELLSLKVMLAKYLFKKCDQAREIGPSYVHIICHFLDFRF